MKKIFSDFLKYIRIKSSLKLGFKQNMYQKEMTISMQKKKGLKNCFKVLCITRPVKLFDMKFFNKKYI